jgi:hypothetical protein
MTLKEVSHHTKSQAQQLKFNRAREQEHHEFRARCDCMYGS